MTPGSPDEALHFRGETLTPESPRPLHIAEPDNIPVLQHQMDPVFNDTSTYETRDFVLGGDLHANPDHLASQNHSRAVPRTQAQQHNGQLSIEQQQQRQYAAAVGSESSAGIQSSAGLTQEPGHHHQQQKQQQESQQQSSSSSHPGSYPLGSVPTFLSGASNNNSNNIIIIHSSASISSPTANYSSPISAISTTTSLDARIPAERNSSLTAFRPPDPANSLPHQSSPNRPLPPAPSSSHAPQGFPAVDEVDHPMTDWNEQSTAPEERLDSSNFPSQDSAVSSGDGGGGGGGGTGTGTVGGVDFQNLLDNLPSSSTAVPSAPAVSEPAPPSLVQHNNHQASGFPQATTATSDGASTTTAATTNNEAASYQSSLGLPPRPPPQEEPQTHPNYHPSDDIRTYHQLPSQSSNPPAPSSSSYSTQQQSNDNPQSTLGAPALAAAGAPGTSSGANSLPPPPGLSLPKSESSSIEPQESPTLKNGRLDKHQQSQQQQQQQPPLRTLKNSDDDVPWGPEVQRKYDDFLHNERIYVTEGLWDRFPMGSRLFVGNLPTERVTKRDLFHIFHKYGKLAQVSIKQAYGFIQFLDSSACKKALDAEQGAVVRGRKIHLEISKPQRNTRPGPPPAEPPRPAPTRRSRTPPEYTRGAPPGGRNPRAPPGDRYDRAFEPGGRVPFSDFRDEVTHRRRDDYRPPPRSPSPRPFRREGYRSRDRTPERYDRRDRRRSRSPPPFGRDRRYRSPSPRGRGAFDGEADLPVPRRSSRDVPDVQVLVLEEVDRNFVFLVENSFRNRGLRVDVLVLGPRIPLNAAVQRQIIEGVLAVVRLSRPNQFSRKIPLQVFDRTGGPDNLRFNEYPELEPNLAAEIVFHAQTAHRGGPPPPFTPATPFGMPPLPPAPVPQQPMPALSNPPNVANMITSLDGSTLQSLLSALQPRPAMPTAVPQQPFPPPNTPQAAAPADLASLLSNAAARPPVTTAAASQPAPLPGQQFPVQAPAAPVVPDPNLLSLLSKGLGGQQPQNQTSMGPHVQNIINQLTKWKQ